ncbi:MAG: DUF1674 domain-containing protein [Pseudomonadota bacterium]|nr:DUF1674 domain-containing protein [Pseudomonadota bacterium]
MAKTKPDKSSDRKRQQPPKERPAREPDAQRRPVEIGGPAGPEPTRYGDWERGGRCSDF